MVASCLSRIAWVAACLMCTGCGLFANAQRSLLYHPQPAIADSIGVTEVLPISDARVLISVVHRDGLKAVIYFAGNGDSAASALPLLSQVFSEDSIYALNYRGYAGSSGTPTEAALQSDALALFDDVVMTRPNIIVVGRSLGTGIAIRVAAQRPVDALVLVTPYNSILELSMQLAPLIPKSWLSEDTYESWRDAPQVTAPTIILAADHDQTIPRDSTERLLHAFHPGVAEMHVVPDTDHSSIVTSDGYRTRLQDLERSQSSR